MAQRNIQYGKGVIERDYEDETCLASEREQFAKGIIDGEQVEETCLEGGQMSFRQTQWDIARSAYKLFIINLENDEDVSAARGVVMTVKAAASDPDTQILIQLKYDQTESDLKTGKIVFKFVPSTTDDLDPMTYWFDIWLELTTDERYQVAIGTLGIRKNVWRKF